MNEAHDEMQDAPLRRGKDSKKKPRYCLYLFLKLSTIFSLNVDSLKVHTRLSLFKFELPLSIFRDMTI